MKPILLLLAVCAFLRVHATDPATSASNVQFPVAYVDGGQFTVTFNTGSGNGRIVVIKAGGDITGKPVDGTTYNASTFNGNASMSAAVPFTGPGEWVVYRGTSGTVAVTGLTPGTTYYVAIFEYSTSGTPNPDYSDATPQNNFVTTRSAPATNASITSISSVTGNSVRVNYVNGGGSSRIIVARKGSAVTALPVDLQAYNYNAAFGQSTGSSYTLDAETFVVYRSSGSQGVATYTDISNLDPNTQYTFAVFEFNGSSSPVYKTPGVSQSVTTLAGPTQAGNGVSFGSVEGNAIPINWTRGNGSRTIVVVKKGSAVSNLPVNGQSYFADAAFGNPAAEWVPNSGEFVVSAGTAVSATVTNLEKFTTYYFAVFSYDADASNHTYYLTTTVHKSQSTALAPTSNRTISVTSFTGSTAQLAYGNVNGNNGAYRLTAIRRDDPITWTPTDLVKYNSGTAVYGSGQLVAPGTYLLFGQSNGGAPNITNLTPGHVYYVMCWDFNGSNAPVYHATGSGTQFIIPNQPTSVPANPTFPTIDGNRLRFDWQNGDGGKRLVIIRKGAPVSTLPVDGTDYTADAQYGNGQEMGNGLGEYVVYNSNGSSVTVTGLDPASTYHFAVVEYNVTAGSADYLVTAGSWLQASRATYSAPTTQTTITGTSSISTTTATVTFSIGNGTSRVFVMKAGGAVDAVPADLQSYSPNASFGSVGSHMGNGNYAVSNNNGGQFTATNLQPGVTYHVAAFEFNGSSGPVYLKPASTFSFTTNSVIAAPTAGATTPLVENADGNKLTFRWASGNGAGRIVIARKASAVSFTPVDGTGYAGNADFGSATDQGSGNRVVYNGTGNTVSITGLEPSATYHFAVIEYNGSGATAVYAPALKLAASGNTATAPAAKSSDPVLTPLATSIGLNWNGGSGAGRLVLVRAGSAPVSGPADLTKYTADARYGNGPQLAAGEYIVFAGSGNSVTVTGLTPGQTYHFKVVEYNGIDAPVYLNSDVLTMSASTAAGTLPVNWLYVRGSRQGDQNLLEWATAQEQNSDRFVVERAAPGGAFTAIGTVAAAGNSNAVRHYTFRDAAAPVGLALYRLRQVDRDGQFRYSITLTLRGGGGPVRLLQNPVQGAPLVDNGGAAGAAWQIADMRGRILAAGTLQSGLQRLNTRTLPAGRYLLLVSPRQGEPQSLSFLVP